MVVTMSLYLVMTLPTTTVVVVVARVITRAVTNTPKVLTTFLAHKQVLALTVASALLLVLMLMSLEVFKRKDS